PLGGYVKISGMSSEEVFETPAQERRAYCNQPVWKRIAVITAGPAVNLVLAFILFWVFLLGSVHLVTTRNGDPIVTPRIASVEAHAAATGKLRAGDVLVSVDGVRGSVQRMHRQIQSHTCAGGSTASGCEASTAATVVVRRDGALRSFTIRPRYSRAYHEPLMGFAFDDKTAPYGAVYAARRSVASLWDVTALTVSDIAQIFKAKDRDQLSGPVGVYAITAERFGSGFNTGIEVLALISLSLGVINLFPFLPLDGGHVFWALAEKVRGRRIPIAMMERAGLIGVILIVLLFMIGLSNDISSLTSPGGFNIH
ncbi:MAG: M50 family metallopeptidase, partial [Solirubrobacteraceae bacterium]